MDFEYQSMRTFADSWGLLYLTLVFVAVVVWVLRPGARKAADEAARIPFKED
ncbi:MAG TPA: cbb3-type cytochrome c oxidase subunit 3 [Aurantimonas sp.]|uniref:Cbb3-type cytochrome c oxidase subunit 3 n=1 Tax=Aurantimonas marianensis TaxID=2920428 RepID=A0A9X2KGU7_9HYPH|nr:MULTISPECIES: cbb3-type cytochrome c oxidase subunit 3 [Aurantimonas]MCP3054042.1 cbb3-type cytochrome c oxidase subunit 3 [Aurantimonas marianensis]